jgi:hypothetical protein
LTGICSLVGRLSFDPFALVPTSTRSLRAGPETLFLFPGIIAINVLGLEVARSLLLEEVATNDITDIVTGHHVSMHVLFAL